MQLQRSRRFLAATAIATAAALAFAGCGGGTKDGSTDKPAASTGSESGAPAAAGDTDRTMVIWAGSQTPIVANFNPYSPTLLHATTGGVFETLFAYNKTKAEAPKPLLGESFEWSDEGKTLTIKLRPGVKWNDSKDFTADDVVYSFTNKTAKPTYLKDATVVDPTTVKLTFEKAEYANEFALLGSTWMVPKHVWEGVADPLTFTNDKDPVGTGPYMFVDASDAAYNMKANPNYWDTGKPAVKSLKYIGIDANQSAEDLLKQGKIDWSGVFIPDPENLTAAGLGYINTPMDPTVLYTCANKDLGCKGAQTDVAVRQALNLAVDRTAIKDKAFVGLTGEISPTFCLLGRDDSWIADSANTTSPQSPDVAGAKKILEDAGYTLGGDGIFEKDGQKVKMTLTSVDGWTDYNSATQQVAEQAKAAGIQIDVSTVSWNEFSDSRQTGNYQLIMGGVVGTSIADPFQIYRDWFSTPFTAKVGENVPAGAWNFSRYSNKKVDDAVAAAAATQDEATKKEAYATIQTEIVRDLPYIPIVINATQTFYNQKDYTGWPTEDNLYAFPPSWGASSLGVVLTTVTGTGK